MYEHWAGIMHKFWVEGYNHFMLSERVKGWVGYIPAVFLGLFIGRLVSEQIRPGLIGAILVTLIATLLSFLTIRRASFQHSWPLLLLSLYVVAPEPDPKTAVMVGFLTAVTLLLNIGPRPIVDLVGRFQMNERQQQAFILISLAVGFLFLYISTLAPDVLTADNGEFQLIAAELGVAHPPGFPLYTMLAHLMTRLPFNAPAAYMVNLFSALTSTATLLLVYLAVFRLTQQSIAGITAALALGTATTFWAQATTANIRSLTGLFAAAAIYALTVLWEQNQANKEENSPTKSTLIPFILILSLGLTHHASLIFMGLVFVLFVLLLNRKLVTNRRYWPGYIGAGLTGLLPLLYLVWRGAVGARGAPDDLTTLSGFLNHVLALGFRGDFFYFTDLPLLLERLRIMVNVLTFQFDPILLVGTAVGLLFLIRYHWKLALLLGGSFLVHAFVTATYRAPQTVEYMLPAYIPLVICLGYGLSRARPLLQPLAAALLLTTVLGQTDDLLPGFQALHSESDTRHYVEPLLEQAPADAVILADWHWATPLWYLQTIEGRRRDVDIHFVFPTAEPYEETWARRIREGYEDGRPVLATHFHEGAYATLPAWEPIGEAYLFSPESREALPNNFTPLALELGSAVEIVGYRLEHDSAEIGQETLLTLAWQPLASMENLSLFAHLVGADGQLYGQHDQAVFGRIGGLTLTQFSLTPSFGAAPGDYAIMIGAYTPEPLLDGAGESRTNIASLTVTAMSNPPYTANPVYRTVPSGRPLLRLVGYDWDHTLDSPRLYLHWQTEEGYQTEVREGFSSADLVLPDWFGPWGIQREHKLADDNPNNQYVPFGQGIIWHSRSTVDFPPTVNPDQTITLRQPFFSNQPVVRDLVVSVRLVGYEPDGFHWAWWHLDDNVPALGAIPTLKWMAGSAVIDPHLVTVSPDASPGQQIGALLRLYDAFTGRPLPILDNRIGQEAPWVPTGGTVVED